MLDNVEEETSKFIDYFENILDVQVDTTREMMRICPHSVNCEQKSSGEFPSIPDLNGVCELAYNPDKNKGYVIGVRTQDFSAVGNKYKEKLKPEIKEVLIENYGKYDNPKDRIVAIKEKLFSFVKIQFYVFLCGTSKARKDVLLNAIAMHYLCDILSNVITACINYSKSHNITDEETIKLIKKVS